MSQPDILFKGVPKRNVRGYVADVIRHIGPKKVVIPCGGAFAFAYSIAKAGFPPSQMDVCDISLYTSVLGAYYSGKDFRIEAKEGWEWLDPFMTDGAGKAAAVVVGIRYLQYCQGKTISVYKAEHLRELRENTPLYIDDIRETLSEYNKVLSGIDYKAEDMRDLIERNRHDPDTVIVCAPPWYKGGYDKMYAGVETVFNWDEPKVAQFDPDEWPTLVDNLANSRSTTMLLYSTPVSACENPEHLFGPPWRSIFADKPKDSGGSVVSWLVCNKPEKTNPAIARDDMSVGVSAKYRLFMENPVTPESKLVVRPERKDVVSYFRDLLVHRLALRSTELYLSLLLDGELLAVMGFHMQDFHTRPDASVKQTFCFTPKHARYKHIHKLALLAHTSSWFWQSLSDEGHIADIFGIPTGVQTTMFSKFAEVMTVRGIYKLKSREVDKKHGFKLSYYANMVERSPDETIAFWLKKWGKENGNA